MVPHLFDCWDDVRRRVAAARTVHLFLDFDGTLVPLDDEPEDIELSTRTRRALARLIRHRRITAAIVSGRRSRKLIGHVRLPGVQCWGFGDDATDEPAFAVLSRGITVRVGADHPTRARYRLSDPDEVRSFIGRLDAELP